MCQTELRMPGDMLMHMHILMLFIRPQAGSGKTAIQKSIWPHATTPAFHLSLEQRTRLTRCSESLKAAWT